jgi:hypothetical protein
LVPKVSHILGSNFQSKHDNALIKRYISAKVNAVSEFCYYAFQGDLRVIFYRFGACASREGGGNP